MIQASSNWPHSHMHQLASIRCTRYDCSTSERTLIAVSSHILITAFSSSSPLWQCQCEDRDLPLKIGESLSPVVGTFDFSLLLVSQLDAIEAQHQLIGGHQPGLGFLILPKCLQRYPWAAGACGEIKFFHLSMNKSHSNTLLSFL